MFPERFTSIDFFQKKKNILLYKAASDSTHYLLKCTDSADLSVRQAFRDEYHVMSGLSHSSVPVYYGIHEQFSLPDQEGTFLALCMEDCLLEFPKKALPYQITSDKVHPGESISAQTSSELLSCDSFASGLSLPEILTILAQTSDVLLWLLDHGVLYTDLNPSNLIIHRQDSGLTISLVDYTYCYYFLKNPHPEYSLRFTYDLSPSLKGQQLLIQELAYLLQDLIEEQEEGSISSRVYRLMETGMNPAEHLSLADYSRMIQQTLI